VKYMEREFSSSLPANFHTHTQIRANITEMAVYKSINKTALTSFIQSGPAGLKPICIFWIAMWNTGWFK